MENENYVKPQVTDERLQLLFDRSAKKLGESETLNTRSGFWQDMCWVLNDYKQLRSSPVPTDSGGVDVEGVTVKQMVFGEEKEIFGAWKTLRETHNNDPHILKVIDVVQSSLTQPPSLDVSLEEKPNPTQRQAADRLSEANSALDEYILSGTTNKPNPEHDPAGFEEWQKQWHKTDWELKKSIMDANTTYKQTRQENTPDSSGGGVDVEKADLLASEIYEWFASPADESEKCHAEIEHISEMIVKAFTPSNPAKLENPSVDKEEGEIKVMAEDEVALVQSAKRYAHIAHRGQKDFNGPEYITHPERVANNFTDGVHQAVGWLHDVVEDDPDTTRDLILSSWPPEVADAVMCLTKEPGEDYFKYIDRVKYNPVAVAVKLADLRDNMDVTRFHRPLERVDVERLEKYRKAYHLLTTQPLQTQPSASVGGQEKE